MLDKVYRAAIWLLLLIMAILAVIFFLVWDFKVQLERRNSKRKQKAKESTA
tara:strand:- start:637 stop:789 length:153 start_codon:yes stop_codon:yes gene_type:complete